MFQLPQNATIELGRLFLLTQFKAIWNAHIFQSIEELDKAIAHLPVLDTR